MSKDLLAQLVRTPEGRNTIAQAMVAPLENQIRYLGLTAKVFNRGVEDEEGSKLLSWAYVCSPVCSTEHIIDNLEKTVLLAATQVKCADDKRLLVHLNAESTSKFFQEPVVPVEHGHMILSARDYAQIRKMPWKGYQMEPTYNREYLQCGLRGYWFNCALLTSNYCPRGTVIVTRPDVGSLTQRVSVQYDQEAWDEGEFRFKVQLDTEIRFFPDRVAIYCFDDTHPFTIKSLWD